MTISILGCGWYGLPLAKALVNDGYKIKGSTTSANKVEQLANAGIKPFVLDLSTDQSTFPDEFFDTDILIIAIPPKTRSGEGQEYLAKMEKVVESIIKHQISKVILISSTGVYADMNKMVNEDIPPDPDTESGKILLNAEALFQQRISFKTTVIRFGGLVGPGRHPGRFFAGKQGVANGLAPVNLIHLDDCIGITKTIISKNAYECTFNAVAPHHPTRADFYTQAAEQGGLALPGFILKLDRWKIVESMNVPEILNYQYDANNWYTALDHKF
ncbi:SDR family oxidoreductase [Mucilaginibacter achroorhodeus]|uniref:SDR family oxidoreductase n=1 Tax=Mucilaginibacter achroorhodeus TaxID=2599294 RepID=A0A563U2K3_9SPHI|nr:MULTISPECIES: SDR family oxidoreductase [Mucilaginibacter]QXV64114.1 SDR family oxidoreductase [Mucilaginibacter sp. 21P]TWR25564.1 SDR family oxidoreductase [Mucilaginibacter achroorhodeus]